MITSSSPRRTPAASRSSDCSLGQGGAHGGFTLVEITIALGIFAFCIVAILGLLQVALNSSRDSRIDSSTCGILNNLEADIRAAAVPALGGTNFPDQYFDVAGNPLVSSNSPDVQFRVTLQRVSDQSVGNLFSLTNGSMLQLWAATISYPPPGYNQTKKFVFGRQAW